MGKVIKNDRCNGFIINIEEDWDGGYVGFIYTGWMYYRGMTGKCDTINEALSKARKFARNRPEETPDEY